MILGCHCTITSDFERPSNYDAQSILTDVGMLALRAVSNLPGAAYGNLVVMPDYQGYGATVSEIHPYLSQDLTARQALDGAKAAMAFYKQKHKMEDKWKTLATGYSQGGSVAMAIQRYIEKNNLVEEFKFAGAVCGEGPYDPYTTLQNYVKTNEMFMPVAVACMIYSMCNTNPRLMGKYSPEDFLTEKFIKSGIIELIEAKNLMTDAIQEELLNYSAQFNESEENTLCMYRFAKDKNYHPYRKDTKDSFEWDPTLAKGSYAKTSDILQEDAFNYFKDSVLPEDKDRKEALLTIESALKDNVLHTNWMPEHPLFLIHSKHDEVVTLENYKECLKSWQGSDMVKGVVYNGNTKYHVNFGKIFYNSHLDMGLTAILKGKVQNYKFDDVDNGIM